MLSWIRAVTSGKDLPGKTCTTLPGTSTTSILCYLCRVLTGSEPGIVSSRRSPWSRAFVCNLPVVRRAFSAWSVRLAFVSVYSELIPLRPVSWYLLIHGTAFTNKSPCRCAAWIWKSVVFGRCITLVIVWSERHRMINTIDLVTSVVSLSRLMFQLSGSLKTLAWSYSWAGYLWHTEPKRRATDEISERHPPSSPDRPKYSTSLHCCNQ